jgi:hypothetical protein
VTRRTLVAALLPITIACSALLTAACADSGIAQLGNIVSSDSAGLQLFTIAGNPRELPALRVESRLALTGAAEDYFNGNPGTGYPLRDGRTLLTDGVTVGVFGSDGAYQGPFSRRGQGPGEIQRIGQLWQDASDSIWLFDAVNRRVSRYSPSLEYQRGHPLAQGTQTGRGFDVWATGVGDTAGVVEMVFDPSASAEGLHTREARFGLWVIGQPSAVLGEARGYSEFQVMAEGGGMVLISSPFSRTGRWVALGRCYLYGFADRWSFTLQAAGDSMRLRDVAILRAPHDRAEAITSELRDRLLAPLLNTAATPAARQEAERIYRTQLIYPDSTAHFSRVQVSRDGALWVQAFRGPTTDEADHWTVVDLHSLRVWRLEVPAGSRVLGVDSARVLIGTKDEDDVESQAWWSLPELAGIRPPTVCLPK